jgi:CDP-diacylglycerol--glycerol-3-phosphate 3-phosphatidyltransferase
MATITPPPARPPIFNLPNQLTASRFVLALLLFGLIAYHIWLGCLLVFIVAAFTDWLDGYLARKQGLTSTLGRNLDPLVDKVLMCGAFTFLLPINQKMEVGLSAWMVVVVVARELIITSLRGFLEGEGIRFGADMLGKIKMWLQCAALVAVFVTFYEYTPGDWRTSWCPWFLYTMVAATALSGAQYLWKATLLLKSE